LFNFAIKTARTVEVPYTELHTAVSFNYNLQICYTLCDFITYFTYIII
jgi:hypothetical protein